MLSGVSYRLAVPVVVDTVCLRGLVVDAVAVTVGLPLPVVVTSVAVSYLPVAVDVAVSYLSLVPDLKDGMLGMDERAGSSGNGRPGERELAELTEDPEAIVLGRA